MAIPELPIAAFKRVPFIDDIPIIGFDWSGATFRMEIRDVRGFTTTALISLTMQTAGTQGLSATYNATYALPEPLTGTAPATILKIQIDETTLEALALNNPVDQPLALFYDIHVTPSGSFKRVLCGGTFDIYPGSTAG